MVGASICTLSPMDVRERHRRFALAFGIGVPLMQLGRVLLWGRWPKPLEVPIEIDGYLAGLILIVSAVVATRRTPSGQLFLAGAWGIWCGVLYRTFTGQLADPYRHSGHDALVLGVKGVLLIVATGGLVGAIRNGTGPAS